MKMFAIVAVALIFADVLALLYGLFSYNKDTQGPKQGPIQSALKRTKPIKIPHGTGAGAMLLGAGRLLHGRGKP